jgi:hypothetical protein
MGEVAPVFARVVWPVAEHDTVYPVMLLPPLLVGAVKLT